ncbi:hypothetical protein [Nostoc sp.]|uniref:hypothetical protein n=1 Tax=Nostoc sp. TaxID=1180 RepID=UPI002FF76FDA
MNYASNCKRLKPQAFRLFLVPFGTDQNPVSTFYETLKTRESSTRKMWICSGSSQMGD